MNQLSRTRMHWDRPRLVVICAVLFSVLIMESVRADEVVLVPGAGTRAPGGRVRGRITTESPESVRVDNQTIPLEEIEEIRYTTPGAEYTQAVSRSNSPDGVERTIELFEEAAEKAQNPLVRQDAQYRRAEVLRRQAQRDPEYRPKALEAFRSIVRELPQSRHVGPSLRQLALMEIEAQEFDEAEATLNEFGKLGWASNEAAILQARLMAKRGQSEAALEALDGLLNRLPDNSSSALLATLAKSEALVGLGKFDEAEQLAEDLIETSDPEDAQTLAPAYNTLGDCLRAAGKPQEALFAYLHTDIFYSDSGEEHARALASIAQLWQVLNRSDRAAEVVDRLRNEHPNSNYLGAVGTAP